MSHVTQIEFLKPTASRSYDDRECAIVFLEKRRVQTWRCGPAIDSVQEAPFTTS